MQSLARGLALLLEVAARSGDLTAKELSDRTGLARQTTYHLLHTLREAGFVQKGADQRYALGLAVGGLVEAFEHQLAPPAALMAQLTSLAAETGEACSIAGWQGDDVVVLAHVPGEHAVRVSDVHAGQRGHLHARASGKLLLAFTSDERRQRILPTLRYETLGPRTVGKPDLLLAELEQIKTQGYATDDEEFAAGISCIAALVTVGVSHLAFSILAPTQRFHERHDDYVEAALRAAQRASTRSLSQK